MIQERLEEAIKRVRVKEIRKNALNMHVLH